MRGLIRMLALAAAAVALSLLWVGCGGPDHSLEHDAVVADLPELSGVDLIDTERSTYCTQDSCPFGNDAMNSTYTYRVSDAAPTERELIATFTSSFPNVESRVCESLETDPERCVFDFDHRASAWFEVGAWSVRVDTLQWADGLFTINLHGEPATG